MIVTLSVLGNSLDEEYSIQVEKGLEFPGN
jgi:hypothetical protein